MRQFLRRALALLLMVLMLPLDTLGGVITTRAYAAERTGNYIERA